MKPFNKRQLGRDPSMGRVTFACGTQPHLKDRLRKRKTKAAKTQLRRDLRGE